MLKRHKRQRVTVKFMCEWAVSSSHHSIHDKIRSGHFLSKTSEVTQQNHYFHLCFKCVGKKINASPKPYYLPRPWVTFFLSLFPYPPQPPPAPLHSYSTTKYSSRWLGFNNSRSWWGHSWRANTGTVSSICLWMGNNYPIPPDTSSWQRRGHKVTKRNKAKVDLAVDTTTKGFRSIRFNICAIFKSNAVFPSSHLTGHCPNTFEALTTF